MILPLKTSVELLSDMGGYAVDCRMLFLGDRVRLLSRAYAEIVRRFRKIPDADQLFRSLQTSDEIMQFYEVQKSNGITSVTLRDSAFRERGSLDDLKIDVRFRLESKQFICPLPFEQMSALGNLLPLLRKSWTETQIKESLQQHLNAKQLEWAIQLLSQLKEKGFTSELTLPQSHFQKATPGSRVTFLGHSSLLFQTENTHVLTDPILRFDNGLPEHGMDVARFPLNAIISSHSHYDHCDLQSCLWFDKDILYVVPKVTEPTAFNPPVVEAMKTIGFRNFREATLWEPVQIGDLELIPVPFHGEEDEPGGKMDHFTYILRSKDLSVYAGVDCYQDKFSDMIPVLEKVREEYHPAMAFLPVSKSIYRYDSGGFAGFCRYLDTSLLNQTYQYTASAEDAVDWVKTLNPKWVSPYATFNFAPLSTPFQVREFEKALKEANLEKHFFPLPPFGYLDSSDFNQAKEFRRRAMIQWFRTGVALRKYDRRMQENRIYRFLRYRGKKVQQAVEHH